MTTGNDTRDFRQTVIAPDGTSCTNVGTQWQRIWSGGDNPNLIAGNKKNTRPAIWQPNPSYVRKVWTRPPKRARSNGEHAYDCTITSSTNPLVSYTISSWPFNTVWGTAAGFSGGVTFDTKWSPNDDLAMMGKLREQVSGGTFNAAITVAEGKESLQMILHAAKALDTAYRAAKRGNFSAAAKAIVDYEKGRGRSGAKASKTIGKNWLKNQFGVQPLLNDVQEAATSLAHFSSTPMQRTYTVTRKINGVVRSASPTAYAVVSGFGYEAVKIKAVIREVNVAQLYGLTDVASVVWEKIPFSFVADWFIPIGSFLAARGLSQSLTGTFVTTRTTQWEANGLTAGSGNKSTNLSGFGNYRRRSVVVHRTVSGSLMVPLPSVKPMAKLASWSHATTAIALLLQRHGSASAGAHPV